MAKSSIKKSEISEEQSGKVRTSIWIDPALLAKIQYIAFMDDNYKSQTDFTTQVFQKAVSEWEKKNGEAVKR